MDDLLLAVGNPLVGAALAATLVAYVVYALVYQHRILATRAEKHLARLTGDAEAESVAGVVVEDYDPRSYAYKFQAAGVNVGPDQAETYLLVISAGLGLTVAVIALALGLPPLAALALGAVSALYPRQWLDGKVKERGRRIDQELENAYGHIASMIHQKSDLEGILLRVAQVLEAKEMDSPLAHEFRRTALGLRHEGRKALDDLERRASHLSPSLATLAFQLKRYMEKGGASYAEAFSHSAKTIKQVLKARNDADAKSANALSNAKLMPALMGLTMLFFVRQPETAAAYRMPAVQLLLGAIILWMGLGYWFMKGMIEEIG
jgi:Flp pilus assembly protein TadB